MGRWAQDLLLVLGVGPLGEALLPPPGVGLPVVVGAWSAAGTSGSEGSPPAGSGGGAALGRAPEEV